MCRRIALLAVSVLVMLSDLTWAERRQERQIADLLHADRFDMGVRIHVVRRKDGAKELIPGTPLEVVDTVHRGHMCRVWTEHGKRRAAWCGPSQYRTTWFVSEQQAPIVLHDGGAPWRLVQGSEGAGKTVAIAMWLWLRVLENVGTDAEIGFTAPIERRIEHIRRKIAEHWPAGTWRYNSAQKLYTTHAGVRVQLVSAHVRSEAEGDPIQGYNWVACASDELQDHFASDASIIARLRSAPDGRGKRLCSSTFKDSPDWRNFRARAEAATERWEFSRLLGLDSPFVHPEQWAGAKVGMTEREWRRRVLAEDVGPERQVYYSWRRVDDRGKPGNLRPIPLNAVDVTARELSRYGKNLGLLLGHDPGKRQHVTEVLKAYEFPGERRVDVNGRKLPPLVRWFVVDEITSDVYNADEPKKVAGPVTMERHVECVLRRVREKWGCLQTDWRGNRDSEASGAVVRIDPHTTSGDEHPDRVVYTQWRAYGFTTFAAAYNPQTNKPTPIKVDTRIDLLNTLLCNVEDDRRLFVLSDDRGQPAAPWLVKALESMERDEAGRAEWENKDSTDLSHWPAAVAFALWSIEKPRLDAIRNRMGTV